MPAPALRRYDLVTALTAELVDRPLDILVNNAGTTGVGPIETVTSAGFLPTWRSKGTLASRPVVGAGYVR
ncbi:hypothetical protein GCM10009838_23340 [Catenulispora subtropica]|uniref:Short-chain dehydrogenase/reductase SDR n=1 Tax=Catenulispora subtropica TaxID=450798 RepID=A0ABN2R844_9ACTN